MILPHAAPESILAYEDENPRPYGFKRLLRAVKEAVPVQRLAEDLGQGRCPIHGGQSRDAFRVYPEQGRWHCFRCNEGGDVLDLFQKAKGYFDPKHALIDLAGEYGVQAPPRPEGWGEWQTEKSKRHRAMRDVLAESYRRRLFRILAPTLEEISDPAEREAEARALYRDLGTVATDSAEWRLAR